MKLISIHNNSFHDSETKFYLVDENLEIKLSTPNEKMNAKIYLKNNYIGNSFDHKELSIKYPEYSQIFFNACKSDLENINSVSW